MTQGGTDTQQHEGARMTQEHGQQFLVQLPRIKHDLPFSPTLLRKLFTQTEERSLTPMDEIAATVSKDQGLTARLLTMANSAFYGLQAQVTNVQRAVTVLGLKEIRNMVVVLGIKALSRRHPAPQGFDLIEYWKHQFLVGLVAKTLAKRTRKAEPENMFTAGLLHDLGKLIVALYRPEDWLAVQALKAAEKLSDIEAEERHWGLDHGVIGALVLKSWDLPAELCEAVNWHHAPAAAPEFAAEAATICLADALVRAATEPPGSFTDVARKACADLGVDLAAARAAAAAALAEESVDSFVRLLA